MKRIIFLLGLIFLTLVACGQNVFKYPLIVGSNGGTGGYLQLNGSTSGAATISVPPVAGTVTFQLPASNGTNGYVLTTNGSGVLSWAVGGAGSMVYPGLGIGLSDGTQWLGSITNNSANWNTAYGWGNHASAGYAPINNATFTGTHAIPLPFTAGTTEVTDIETYSTENYGATGTGDIVLSTGATMTTVNITDVIKLTPTASPPSGATEGMIYMDTDHHLYVHNGTTWVHLDN